MIPSHISLNLSGERFTVVYRLTGDAAEAKAKAHAICIEQTIEFPPELVPPGDILDQIIGQLVSIEAVAPTHFEATISYPIEASGLELTQLLNLIFGNSSIKPGIRVERLDLPDTMLQAFKGPRFGRAGLRKLLGVPTRPLLCTALKPMGLPAEKLAQFAYQCAIGGIDIIKDDHGLADQSIAPFQERVTRCAEAVQRANAETGYNAIYMPNITAPADRLLEKALWSKGVGAGGLLISPGLVGFDALRQLAAEDRLALPVMSHPAFQGSFVTSPDNGISHQVLFGQIARLAGADATIYPNYGGRFSFSREECQRIATASAMEMGTLKPIFPTPGGGMTLESIPDMLQLYGHELIFLIGGGLFRHGPDLVENCRHFHQLVTQM